MIMERYATLTAELRSGGIPGIALGAPDLEHESADPARVRAGRILKTALRAAHESLPRPPPAALFIILVLM